jgi:hypothetical protein
MMRRSHARNATTSSASGVLSSQLGTRAYPEMYFLIILRFSFPWSHGATPILRSCDYLESIVTTSVALESNCMQTCRLW